MKVALICIAKFEEKYIQEFVKHYFQLGIDKIFIGDNNPGKYQPELKPLLSKWLDRGQIVIDDLQDQVIDQVDYYDTVYQREKNNYDWFCIFDCDEFLVLNKHKNIAEFLS